MVVVCQQPSRTVLYKTTVPKTLQRENLKTFLAIPQARMIAQSIRWVERSNRWVKLSLKPPAFPPLATVIHLLHNPPRLGLKIMLRVN